MERFRFFVVLYCLSKYNGERSIYAIYHLLQGKKSSQTIQDAKLFKLESFFQLMQQLSKKDIDEIIFELQCRDVISMTNKDTYILTEKGFFYLESYMQKYPIPPYLNGWRNHKKARLLWQRFSLMTQTLSFLLYENSSFTPVISDEETQHFVKSYFKKIKNRYDMAEGIFNEVTCLLQPLPQVQAEIFVLHLSGYQRVGYTIEQIGRIRHIDSEYTFLLFQAVLHHMIATIETNPIRFRHLRSFIEQDDQSIAPLTQSSQKTYELLRLNKSITEIALIRNLKESTIEDHIVEIASELKSFNIDLFVSNDLQGKIVDSFQTLGTKRLKPIRSSLHDTVSYFQIRLVLGRMEC
ncbi:MAG TPA: RQC domain-containing protein [Bacillales bacterium]|nr:RQC domain-containing protein [Bacillales bacterium]